MNDSDRTASLATPARLAQLRQKSAASPGAWLDQMAADVGSLPVAKLSEAHVKLAAPREHDALAARLQEFAAALRLLDFNLLKTRGWWARTTGKSREAGASFAQQYDDILDRSAAVVKQHGAMQAAHAAQADAGDRVRLDMEVECRALDQVVDQGARWLQDMQTQLKARLAAAGDAAAQAQVREDAARCELLVARLKLLRATSGATQQALRQSRDALAAHVSLLQALQQALGVTLAAWKRQVGPLTSASPDGPELSTEGAMDIQAQLQQQVERCAAACAQSQAVDASLALAVSSLGQQLAAARG